jgi:hypothetical protein
MSDSEIINAFKDAETKSSLMDTSLQLIFSIQRFYELTEITLDFNNLYIVYDSNNKINMANVLDSENFYMIDNANIIEKTTDQSRIGPDKNTTGSFNIIEIGNNFVTNLTLEEGYTFPLKFSVNFYQKSNKKFCAYFNILESDINNEGYIIFTENNIQILENNINNTDDINFFDKYLQTSLQFLANYSIATGYNINLKEIKELDYNYILSNNNLSLIGSIMFANNSIKNQKLTTEQMKQRSQLNTLLSKYISTPIFNLFSNRN